MPQSPNELFDVVDENDVPLRREKRAVVHRERLLHRAVHILVFNAKGEVYGQRRSLTKDTCPGRWTTSCSGHVDAGEDYDTAALRELAEELGIRVSTPQAIEFLFKHPAVRQTGWEFIQVYRLVWEGAIAPDPEEVMEGRWVSPEALTAWMRQSPHEFTASFRLVWEQYCEKARAVTNGRGC